MQELGGNMADGSPSKHVLYRNNDGSIFLMDIPVSIAEAQGFDDNPQLLSCQPLSEPFQTNEPKTAKARAKVTNYTPDQNLHDEIHHSVVAALRHICENKESQPFCFPRQIYDTVDVRQSKRKADALGNGDVDLDSYSVNPFKVTDTATRFWTSKIADFGLDGLRLEMESDESEIFDRSYFNEYNDVAHIRLINDENSQAASYKLPPYSFCLLSRCEDTASFRSAAKIYSPSLEPGRGRFDFILMDPPWPNLSAKRKKQYKGAADHDTIEDALFSLDLDIHIAPRGFIAVWITNNPRIREMVVGPHGLFRSWNVELVEEWIWVKITSEGEPVTPIDGLWRKPYEVLLVAQAPENPYSASAERHSDTAGPKRRVIAAVPDLHSRKPCLKRLIETLLLQRNSDDYKALEVFARYLIRGWMSWGDEVLKFNATSHWKQAP